MIYEVTNKITIQWKCELGACVWIQISWMIALSLLIHTPHLSSVYRNKLTLDRDVCSYICNVLSFNIKHHYIVHKIHRLIGFTLTNVTKKKRRQGELFQLVVTNEIFYAENMNMALCTELAVPFSETLGEHNHRPGLWKTYRPISMQLHMHNMLLKDPISGPLFH